MVGTAARPAGRHRLHLFPFQPCVLGLVQALVNYIASYNIFTFTFDLACICIMSAKAQGKKKGKDSIELLSEMPPAQRMR